MSAPWKKICAGQWESADGTYRAVLGWGDFPGWTLLYIDMGGDSDVVDTYRTLRDAKTAAITPRYHTGGVVDTSRASWKLRDPHLLVPSVTFDADPRGERNA